MPAVEDKSADQSIEMILNATLESSGVCRDWENIN